MLYRSLLAGIILCGVVSAAAVADTLEDAEKKLQEAHAKLESFSANTRVSQEIDMGDAGRNKSETKGTIEWMRKDGKDFMRVDLRTEGEHVAGGQTMKMDQKTLTVSDGEFLYVLTEMVMPTHDGSPGELQKQCYKTRAQEDMGYDPKSTFEALRQNHTLKLMPDDKVDGQDCYVVEAAPKQEIPGYPTVRQMYYLAKESGVNIQMIGYDKDNKPVVTSRVTDLKINPGIKPDRFKFEPPAGVQVIDMTSTSMPDMPEEP